MKKSTDDLMKILRSKSSVGEYFDENDSEIFFGNLSELIDFFMVRKGLTKAKVVRRSGMNRGYCYEIIGGKTPKNISRDKVIMLCFGLTLTVDESQQLLKKKRIRAALREGYARFHYYFLSGKPYQHRQYQYQARGIQS